MSIPSDRLNYVPPRCAHYFTRAKQADGVFVSRCHKCGKVRCLTCGCTKRHRGILGPFTRCADNFHNGKQG
jgi:hypothetical protein